MFGCMAFAAASRCATHAGDVASGRVLVTKSSAARQTSGATLPIISAWALTQLARAHLELGDVAGSRQITREATSIMADRDGFGSLTADLGQLVAQLAELPAGSVGASSLTAAEVRLLPHLATYLTFPEIGERLYVSRHTVKTQALSIYRKLEVSSRKEAVERARALGLLVD